MKYCPTCNAEYEPEHTYCPKDGKRLVRRSKVSGSVGAAHRKTALKSPTQVEPGSQDAGDPWDPGTDPEAITEGVEPDLVGQLVAGRYLIQRQLGEGGMGVVYAGVDQRLEKPVAVKVLREDFARRTDVVARFTQEAKSAARIKHENVLDVTDYGQTEDGSFYITMELLVGSDLADALQKSRTIEPDRGIDIAVQICRALGSAHQKGVIHRDMKPENVFLVRSDDGREIVKIVDFGIAQMKDISGSSPDSARKLTRTGMIFGTPEYMSPEQAAGKVIDHRVDVYATGVILYEMFAGRVPFVGETFMGVLTQHMFEKPPPIREVNPAATLSPDLEAVIAKALAKSPGDRYGSMQELSDDLLRVRMGTRPTAPTPSPHSLSPLADRGSLTGGSSLSSIPGVGPDTVGVSRTVESELTRTSSRKPLVIAGAVLAAAVALGVGYLAVGATGTGGTTTAITPAVHPVAPVAPVAPVTPAAHPVAPPAVPAGQPPVPAVPAAPTAPTRVHIHVTTGGVAASIRGEGPDAAMVFQCDHAPCDAEVPTGAVLHLTATAPHRRGTLDVTPATEGQTVDVTLAATGTRPGRDAHAPVSTGNAGTRGRPNGAGDGTANSPHGGRRCGYLDPATQLLVPCFP